MMDIISRALSENNALSEEVVPKEFVGTKGGYQQRASAATLPENGATSPGRRLESPGRNGKQNTPQQAWVA